MTKKQSSAWRLLTNPKDLALLFGGAKGPGKSFLLCGWVDHWVEYLIDLFELKPSDNPIPLGFIGRKQGVDFTHTTLETFKRIIPSDHYRIKTQEKEIIFKETAKVFYGGLDDQDRIKKFNSAEFAFLAIDQAEETERNDVDVLQATLRLMINGKRPPYKQLYTANPADCWLKEDFIDNKIPGKVFIPALPSENKNLPDTYTETLTQAFKYSKPLLAAYLHGDWFALKNENALISSAMLQDLRGIVFYPKDIKRLVVCDPSLGGDECVIYYLENMKVKDEAYLHERDPMKIAGEMVVMAEKHRVDNYAGDAIGIGSGILARVKELKPHALMIEINSAASSEEDPERFANLRAEMWWYAMTMIMDKKVPYPEDEDLRAQLIAVRFKPINSNGKVLLELKENTKKRIGRSPDRADAWVMGIWATKKARVTVFKDSWREERESSEVSGGAVSAMAA